LKPNSAMAGRDLGHLFLLSASWGVLLESLPD
jgi:hypothetical protein